MPLFKKKPDANNPAAAKKKQPVVPAPRSEFIPYHSHYNPHTLLTKNGELLQIIKIDGNAAGELCENLDGAHATIRDAIRHAVSQHITSEDYAFWLHTVRTRAPIQYHTSFADDFAGYVNDKWEQSKRVESVYNNVVYLTIMHCGQPAPLADGANTIIFPKQNRRVRNRYIDESYKALDALVLAISETLKANCNATRLSLSERTLPITGKAMRQSIFYSEPLTFLGTILNLRQQPFPLPDVDVSVALETSQLAFGFNGIEARDLKTGIKRYAALLSLKQYRDMPPETADRVMQAPMEIIVSQSFKFTPASHALKHYKMQKEFFEISGDTASNDMFGISEMLAGNQKNATDFGEHQTTIMVLTDNAQTLDREVEKFQHTFADLGLITVREDVKLEECFWSQLPGNFSFIRRRDMLATEKAAGFCRLNRFSYGSMRGNHWGDYVSCIPTTVGSPYFFNFHVGDNGHTAIFDFNSFGDQVCRLLEYFLISQTRKYGTRIFLFDQNQSGRLFMHKLGASYFTFSYIAKTNHDQREDRSPRLALNPFALDDSPRNQGFLAAWAGLLIAPNAPLEEALRNTLRQAVAELYAMAPDERNLPRFIAIATRLDPSLGAPFAAWNSGGAYAGLFDSKQDSLDMDTAMMGFDLSPAIAQPAYLLPLFSYIMHRIIASLDGTPTVIALNEAWMLLENPFFAPRLESLMDMLREHNAMLLMTTQKPMDCANLATTENVLKHCATTLYIADEIALDYQTQQVGLSDHDAFILLGLDRQKGEFLVKQNNQSIALRVQLENMEDASAIFTNDLKSLGSAHGRFASIPKDF